MQFKRPQILLTGLLLFFAGVQFRLVESFTLSEKSTHVSSPEPLAGGRPAEND